jgi:hypothetical protein
MFNTAEEVLKNRELIKENIDKINETLSILEGNKNTLLDVLRIYDDRMNIKFDKYVSPYIVNHVK